MIAEKEHPQAHLQQVYVEHEPAAANVVQQAAELVYDAPHGHGFAVFVMTHAAVVADAVEHNAEIPADEDSDESLRETVSHKKSKSPPFPLHDT